MLKKIQKIILYSLLVYTILGYIVLPLILKSQLPQIVQKETNSKISIQSISFNPFIFKLKLNGIELADKQNNKLLTLKALILDIEVYSLFRSALHIKNLRLQEPDIFVVYEKDKTLNLATILKDKDEKVEVKDKSDIEIPRIILDRISVVDGAIKYEDYTHKTKFDFSFENLRFELKDIDTADFNSSDATLRFHTALGDGGFFDLKSEIVGFKPLIVKGSVNFEASKLYSEYKYVQDMLNLEVADGKIDFNAEYYFNLDELNATTIDNMNISVEKLRIKPKHRYKDVLNIESLLVEGIGIKPMQKAVYVSKVTLNSLDLKVKRDMSSKIDWLEYIKIDNIDTADSTEQNATASQNSVPWSVLVDDIALQKIKVDFDDDGVKPRVVTKLNEMNIYLQNVTLSGMKPFSYQMDLRLNEEFICNSYGDIKHNQLAVNSYMKCSNFNIVNYNSYIDELARDALGVYDIELKRATLGFDINASVVEVDEEIQISVGNFNLGIDNFSIDKRSTKESLVDFVAFRVDGLGLSTKKRDLDIKKVTLKDLDIKAKAYKDGTINLENLIVPKALKAVKKAEEQIEDEYSIKLKHFALKSAKVSFDDKTLKPSLKTKIDKINFDAYNIDSKAKSWLDYKLSLRLNSKGYAKSKGKIRHTPFEQKGRFDLDKISLKEFSPYIQKATYLKLDDGYVNLKTKISYAKSAKDADLKVRGRLDIDEVFISDMRDKSSLISFNNMAFKSFNYDMFPNRVFVNELDVDGFYINAIIDENKQMNLASLTRPKKGTATTNGEDKNSTEFPFKIMKLNVSSGSARFADLSLPLKFRTDIHDLNGAIYSISSQKGEVSYIDIVGEVDKYGSTKLIGSIDSSNPEAYTDLDFNFRNLELSSLSGYSADFAGHKIESGKLFLDLGYEIVDSKLLGRNSIIVKNIELGDEIEDENSSSLPLGFAIALLEDSDGIIDIDMPVEGYTDAPDFKYGTLIWDTFGNLIIKGVASPFVFLGSMLGIDGEELKFVEFEPGLANILPPEREKLDNITKLMIKRPKISLKITPQYDDIQDTWMIKKQKLVQLVMQKSGAKNKEDNQNSMNIDLLKDIYKELTKKSSKTIEENLKKTYKGAALKREYLSVLIKESTKMQEVSQKELEDLAYKRAELIKEYLVNKKGLEINKVNLQESRNAQDKKDRWVRIKLEIGS